MGQAKVFEESNPELLRSIISRNMWHSGSPLEELLSVQQPLTAPHPAKLQCVLDLLSWLEVSGHCSSTTLTSLGLGNQPESVPDRLPLILALAGDGGR